MAAVFERLLIEALNNPIIRLVALAIFADTFFGCMRAIRQHKFNSSFGIDGAIRKVSMMASMAFLLVLDKIANINAIALFPEEVKPYFPGSVGLAEFFGFLFLCYEAVSILKNMTYSGLPVKGVWKKAQSFLGKYTDELPSSEEDNNDSTGKTN